MLCVRLLRSPQVEMEDGDEIDIQLMQVSNHSCNLEF